MKQKLVRHFVLGVIATYGFAALVFVCAANLGSLPVQADGARVVTVCPAMPGWGRLPSDDEIRRMVSFMRKSDSLADSVPGESGP